MIIFEDKFTYVFLDIAEDVNGHMVAIPKKHVNNILDCDNETLNHLITTVKMVSNHCVQKCNYDGVNILNASDESAGQSVLHFHFHIIPRKKDDGIDAWPNFTGTTMSQIDLYNLLKIN
jgi:histidine triad (HIT) family protein